MTIEDYNELKLQDELNIGYDVEEEFPDEYEEDSYFDELKTDGFNAVYDPLDELFGEPIAGYSLYKLYTSGLHFATLSLIIKTTTPKYYAELVQKQSHSFRN